MAVSVSGDEGELFLYGRYGVDQGPGWGGGPWLRRQREAVVLQCYLGQSISSVGAISTGAVDRRY